MDTRSEDVIKKQLPEVIGENTLVMITHRSSLLSLVERLIVFDRGRIVADGPRDSVLESLSSGRIATAR
jgi:ATP-binding cassette subfamily C protein LapB